MQPAPTIVLATSNARYHHASLALRTLYANLGRWQESTRLVEFTNAESAADMAERILALEPRLVGLSVYIWNVRELTAVAGILKRLRPDLPIVIGGPEVSHETDGQAIVALADFVVQGEGEDALRQLADRLLGGCDSIAGENSDLVWLTKVISGGLPDLTTMVLPYDAYSDVDLAERTLYVEASRGCPYRCEFCLSSLDLQVRHFPLEKLLRALDRLIERGARHFKFIDRTFNLKLDISAAILRFFLDRHVDGMLFHFEMVPDRLPEGLRELIAQFPAGALQFEVGVQTLDDAVGQRISRRQNLAKMQDNFEFLRNRTGVHVHADLIIGLPGETEASFGAGLDRLFAMGPQEIQVGILKRLRGAPISRHSEAFGLVFDPDPPYEILATSTIDFNSMQRLKRFAFVWDRLVNRGNLPKSLGVLLSEGAPFGPVLRFSEALHRRHGRVHAVSLDQLALGLRDFLVEECGVGADTVEAAIAEDYAAAGRKLPGVLRGQESAGKTARAAHRARQDRHLRMHDGGHDHRP